MVVAIKILKRFSQRGLVLLMDLVMIEENTERGKGISYNDIKNPFDGLPLANPHLGILVICPQELLM